MKTLIKNNLVLLIVLLLSSCRPPEWSETPDTVVTNPAGEMTPLSTRTFPFSASPVCKNETCLVAGVQIDYLIVTRPMFIDALAPFITWKWENGFRVGLVTVEWLATTYPGRHLAEKMKTGIHDLRNHAGVRYVLLVGDTSIVLRTLPSRMFSCPILSQRAIMYRLDITGE